MIWNNITKIIIYPSLVTARGLLMIILQYAAEKAAAKVAERRSRDMVKEVSREVTENVSLIDSGPLDIIKGDI